MTPVTTAARTPTVALTVALPAHLGARWQTARRRKNMTHAQFIGYLLDLDERSRRPRPARTMWQ
jgi:hypothetical protein